MKKGFCLFFCVVFCSLGIFCKDSFFDNYVYQSWNSFGSLNGTTATDILQTSDGYINIGTYEGLSRFDGVSFTTHKRVKGGDLAFVSVRVLIEDSGGNLWIGSNDEGLQKISKDGKKLYTTQNGLPNNSIRALCEDSKGNIWVGTAAGVVYITPQGRLITAQFEAGTAAKGIIATAFYCDTAGRIWLLTAGERGLFLFNDGVFKTRAELDIYDNYFVTTFFQDKNSVFWVGLGDRGFVTLSNGNLEKLNTGTILDTVPTSANYVSQNGTIWFGTEKGLVVYSAGKFYEYQGDILNSAKINKIINDREGNIWIATDRSGIGKLTHGKFKIVKLGIPVNSIAEDRSGKVWAGTDRGLKCYEDEKEVQNFLTQYAEGLRIRDVYGTKNGDVLVSCYSSPGLIRYDGGTSVSYWSKDEGLAGNKVRVAIEAKNGDVYVGTTTGLSIIHKDGSIRNFKQADGLDNEYIMALYQDTNDVIWIGTDGGGIYLLENERIISHFSSDDGLVGNVIFKITQELDGAFWICSGSGITRIPSFDTKKDKPEVYQNINSENGIETDSTFQILADGTNNLWMTSNHGISSVAFSELLGVATGERETVNVKFYNRNDGLDSDGPTSTAKSLTDKYGRIWFTLVDGIALYDPLKMHENPIMPLVQIEKVIVDNTVMMDNTLYSVNATPITLKPGTKRVDIMFSGISFDAPERIRFTYKLTNFEDDFSSPSSSRTMSYTNLHPGKHTFLVNAINGDGLYSSQAEAVLFVQKPYIYQMPIFWIIVVIVFVDLLLLLFYHKQKKIMRENIRLEHMVETRTAELNVAKEKSDSLLRAILPAEIAEELKDEIHSIGRNFDDVTILFSDIVGFTRTSSGHTAAEIVDALNDLFSRFDIRAQKYGVEKIKTIGDAYMATCGLPTPNKNHARIMVDFARGMLEDLAEYNQTAKIHFNIRIGINSGPVTAGVIGRTKFIYDVWGNTVNVASRMETAANPGGIRVSEATYLHLKDSDVRFNAPVECDIKGKGLMTTYDVVIN